MFNNHSVVTSMPMAETMANLISTAEELNRASDDLNAIIDELEEQFETAGVGVVVWQRGLLSAHEVRDGDETKETGFKLGYCKVGGKWQLALQRVERRGDLREWCGDVDFELEPPFALRSAPRNLRVEAGAELEDLAKNITQTMQNYIQGIAKARELVKS